MLFWHSYSSHHLVVNDSPVIVIPLPQSHQDTVPLHLYCEVRGGGNYPSIDLLTTHIMDPRPFREYDSARPDESKVSFLGLPIPTQYIKTSPGLLHGISSLTSLVLGNFLFIKYALLGLDASTTTTSGSKKDFVKLAFWLFTLFSASTTIIMYWNKVQSWQLSTTTMKEKGLTPQQLQNFNRGRGTLTPLSYSLLPLFISVAPNSWLESAHCSIALALTTMALSAGSFTLIREYGKPLFWVYGLYPALVSMMVLWHQRLSAVFLVHSNYPRLLTHMEHQAYFVISCIQVGFLLYYLYSRRLITKEFVQRSCRHYHPTMMFSYLVCDALHFGHGGGGFFLGLPIGLPWTVVVHSIVLRLVGIGYAWKMIMGKRRGGGVAAVG